MVLQAHESHSLLLLHVCVYVNVYTCIYSFTIAKLSSLIYICACICKVHIVHLFCVHRNKFFEIVKDTSQQCFKVGLDKLLKHLAPTGTLTDDHIR